MRLFRRIRNQFDKSMRAYYKMRRKHRRELIKLAKENEDWDYYYLHNFIITKIKHMYEYYSASNVLQTDETLQPIIAQLKYVLDLQEELDCLVDNLDKYKREKKLYKEIYVWISEHLLGWWD